MIAISKPYQDGLNRTVPLSTFTLMCSCLVMRRCFPFCACVHTNICQKGKFVQTKVFENTLFLKIEVAWVPVTKNESFRKRSFCWVLAVSFWYYDDLLSSMQSKFISESYRIYEWDGRGKWENKHTATAGWHRRENKTIQVTDLSNLPKLRAGTS